MGISLAQVNSFAGGLAGGATEGLDLYAKFDAIKQEGENRQKRQNIETQIGELSKSGALKDPIAGTEAIARLYYDNGFAEEGAKYSGTARELTKARNTKQGLETFGMIDADPFFATDSVNKFNEMVGNPTRYEGTPMGTGFQLRTIGPNGKTSERVISDPDELRNIYSKLISPYLLDEQDPLKSRSEIQENEAQTNQANVSSATEMALAGPRQQLLQAQTADAAASAATRGATNASEIARNQAQTNKLVRETEEIGKPTPANDPGLLTAVDEFTKGFTPDFDGNLPVYANPANIAPIANSLQTYNGLSSDAAVARSAQILQALPQIQYDDETNQIRLPGQPPIQVDGPTIATLRTLGTPATKVQ
jgi:hypothetical protein